MIYPISELPKVGAQVVLKNDATLEDENLLCVSHMRDEDNDSIIYALFQNVDIPSYNIYEEQGMPFYSMRGYMAGVDKEMAISEYKADVRRG